MICMCQITFGTGNSDVLDSGFFVVKGIVEMEARGVYAGALIKKWRYWPKNMTGDSIDGNSVNTDVVDVDMLGLKTNEGIQFSFLL